MLLPVSRPRRCKQSRQPHIQQKPQVVPRDTQSHHQPQSGEKQATGEATPGISGPPGSAKCEDPLSTIVSEPTAATGAAASDPTESVVFRCLAPDPSEALSAQISPTAWQHSTPSQQRLRFRAFEPENCYDSAAAVAALERRFCPMHISPPAAERTSYLEHQRASAEQQQGDPPKTRSDFIAGAEERCMIPRQVLQEVQQRWQQAEKMPAAGEHSSVDGADCDMPQTSHLTLYTAELASVGSMAAQQQRVVTTPGGHVALVAATPSSVHPSPAGGCLHAPTTAEAARASELRPKRPSRAHALLPGGPLPPGASTGAEEIGPAPSLTTAPAPRAPLAEMAAIAGAARSPDAGECLTNEPSLHEPRI